MWKFAPRNENRLAHLQAIAIHRLYKSSLNLSRGQIESCWSNITRKAINFFEQLNSSSSRLTSCDRGSGKGSSARRDDVGSEFYPIVLVDEKPRVWVWL